jgi:hypothetical protein
MPYTVHGSNRFVLFFFVICLGYFALDFGWVSPINPKMSESASEEILDYTFLALKNHLKVSQSDLEFWTLEKLIEAYKQLDLHWKAQFVQVFHETESVRHAADIYFPQKTIFEPSFLFIKNLVSSGFVEEAKSFLQPDRSVNERIYAALQIADYAIVNANIKMAEDMLLAAYQLTLTLPDPWHRDYFGDDVAYGYIRLGQYHRGYAIMEHLERPNYCYVMTLLGNRGDFDEAFHLLGTRPFEICQLNSTIDIALRFHQRAEGLTQRNRRIMEQLVHKAGPSTNAFWKP